MNFDNLSTCSQRPATSNQQPASNNRMFWFDLDNSPHVPLFRPIFAELQRRNKAYFITARDFAQTKDLLTLWNIPHALLGKHGGKGKLGKIVNLFQRAQALTRVVQGKPVSLAVSHGSRTQLVAAKRLGIPAVLMLDYEYTEARIFNTLATYLLMPAFIPERRLSDAGFKLQKVVRYTGFKEEIYMRDFVPDPGFRKSLQIDPGTILITLRPPSTLGNYHDEKSEMLFRASLDYFSAHDNTHCLIVNRTEAERKLVDETLAQRKNISFLRRPVDGLQLLWASDVVISGGGTMNREAALLGVPVFSIFTGRRPYLDEYLHEHGRLTFINEVRQMESIPVVKRPANGAFKPTNGQLPAQITELLMDLKQKGQA